MGNFRRSAMICLACVCVFTGALSMSSRAEDVVQDGNTLTEIVVQKTPYEQYSDELFKLLREGGNTYRGYCISSVVLKKEETKPFAEYYYVQHLGKRPPLKALDLKDTDQTWLMFEDSGLKECLAEHDQAAEKLDEIVAGMPELEHDKTIYHYLDYMKQFQYDSDNHNQTVYTMLQSKKGTCYPLSVMFYHLMKREGIPCKVCIGFSTAGVYHSWNMIQFADGTWKPLDLTAKHWGFSSVLLDEETYNKYYGKDFIEVN